MVDVVVNDEQAKQISESKSEDVFVRDTDGRLLGRIQPVYHSSVHTADEIAELEKRLDIPGPRRTTREVLDHLDSLETS